MWVLPRIGNVRIALATVLVAAPEVVVAPDSEPDQGTDCRNLFVCDPVRVRATLQAGFVSPDISSEALQTSDFQEVKARKSLEVNLQVVSPPAGEEAFLSDDDSCNKRSGPLPLDILKGHKSTPVFYLCASGHSATYSIVTELESYPPANNPEPNGASDTEGILIHPYKFPAPALTKGYVATGTGDVKAVKTEQCGGKRVPTAATGPIQISGPLITQNDDNQVVIECNADGDEGDAGIEPLTCESKPFPLELTTGQTCNLEIEDP